MEKYLLNNRVCPLPMNWNELYKILVRETRNSGIQKPLILAAWNFTSDEQKLGRFEEHLKLIEEKNIITAKVFLDGLEEDKWYHKEI
ncbi:hypothetical protein C7S20_05575 [Christiangramia fulva]|uniref:Uncharacterized protein n=1 Tax=Christiangramia fulva TaxID=2126553 RepID=A0A2R3Z3D3_9FLAO|nr:hypothetical protein [Christiangramia fulva]AVR44777.1 hypothetical protein C7S20_05575 [Christiangramia fulva]